MAVKINHTLFGGNSTSSRKAVYVLAAVIVLAAVAWLLTPKNDAEHFQAAYDAGDLDRALKIATVLSEDASTAVNGFRGVAAVHIQKALRGDNAEAELDLALQAALAALDLSGPNADVLRTLGYIHELQGDYAGALAYYEQALELSPNATGALYQMGRFLESRGQGSEAKGFYERAVVADASNDLAHLGIARVYLAEGNIAAAEAAARPATSNNSSGVVAAANVIYSRANMKKGDFTAAAFVAAKAVDLAPDSVSALLALGEARHAQVFGRDGLPFAETLADVRVLADRAAAIDPRDPMAPFLAFKATFALGDRVAADAYAAKTLDLLPTSRLLETERDGVRAYVDVLRNMTLTPRS